MKAEKGFTLFISNEDVSNVIKIMKRLEDLSVLTDRVTETVENQIKAGDGLLGVLLAPLVASLVQPVIATVVKGISGRGVRRAGRGYMDNNFAPSFKQYWGY